MDIRSFTKYCSRSLIKGIIVGLVTLVGASFGHSLALMIGINMSNPIIFLDELSSTLLFLSMITVTAILIGELFKQLNQPFTERVISIFMYHFFFFYFLRMFDGFLSSTKSFSFYEILGHILAAIFFSIAVALLWKPMNEQSSLVEKSTNYFKFKNLKKWLIGYVVASISFALIYYLTNWLILPFIEPFYSDLGNNYGRDIYNFYHLLFAKLIVGGLFVLVLMPIFVLSTMSKTSLLFWIGFPIFVQAAVYPTSVEVWLPLGIRFPFLIQQMVITYFMAIMLVQLFYLPSESDVIDDQFKWMY
ncbi:hypothetical protein RJD24_06690 [Bacillaceae bacterium IKA-2]|nr:hypothetical protein RJD24_06690 [Bacillaceae bacterium IKA-2]